MYKFLTILRSPVQNRLRDICGPPPYGGYSGDDNKSGPISPPQKRLDSNDVSDAIRVD